jgi:serine/threonine-protein kinase
MSDTSEGSPITPERWKRICAVLDRVLDAEPSQRDAVLRAACRAEDVETEDVVRFVSATNRDPEFLEQLPSAVVTEALGPLSERLPLAPGTHLGDYEVIAPIGAGAMGEIYRARDTKLHRDVALKVLPDRFAADPDRLARFKREAQLLAALNHPNIAAIYGFEECGPAARPGETVLALALELVEGQTLAGRLAGGALPVAETLSIARQIVDALEAAHEAGIVHRDLKPSNLKLKGSGAHDDLIVKVLDFGVAKALSSIEATPSASNVPATMTSPAATGAGILIGTVAYMAPEQIKGKTIDQRADIWAFGCVLYEMLTGARAFGGDEVTETLALIVAAEPDWTKLPPDTPASLRQLLSRCLEKDRRRRLAHIADARFDLNETGATPLPPSSVVRAGAPKRVVAWALAVLAIAAAIASVWIPGRVATPEAPAVLRFEIPHPLRRPSVPAISPDGSHLAFQVPTFGRRQIHLRRTNEFESRSLPDVDDAMDPTFSPDGEWLAFLTSSTPMTQPLPSNLRQLKKIRVQGGAAQTLVAEVSPGRTGISWGDDDHIVFTSIDSLLRVPAAGGTPEILAKVDENRNEFLFIDPQVLPGATHVLVTVGMNRDLSESQVVALDVKTRARKVLLENVGIARYAASGPRGLGHLVYARNGSLFAVPFDASRIDIMGAPVRVLEGVREAAFGFSSSGTLAYEWDPAVDMTSTLVWVDRKQEETPLPAGPRGYFEPELSPEGARVALAINRGPEPRGDTDIWIYQLESSVLTRVTFEGNNRSQIWTPDGKRLIYTSTTGPGQSSVVAVAADRSSPPQVLLSGAEQYLPMSVSPDGKVLIVRHDVGAGARRRSSYHLLSLADGSNAVPKLQLFLDSPFPMGRLVISPDGRWAAYQSNESGTEEIYVASFPKPATIVQVSSERGFSPRWGRTGRELFYARREQGKAALVVRDIQSHPAFRAGPARHVLDLIRGRGAFDVGPDGERFLMLKPVADPSQYATRVVVNWFDELRGRVPITR